MNHPDYYRRHRVVLILFLPFLLTAVDTISAQEYVVSSFQISDKHRFDRSEPGLVGGFWGHHLGHMVRTATQGLWYVDDTGEDVDRNPAIQYHRFDGENWSLQKTLANPTTIQQNTATMAIGDTIYTYGVNIIGGYIEEAVFDAKTKTAVYNRKIRSIGTSTNYIGAAVSPTGARIVWWTKVDYNGGPSQWVYMVYRNGEWGPSIISSVPGNDFSYVFASFLNDTVMYVGGEVPSGIAPNWTYEVGAGKVVLGSPIEGFTKMKGSNVAANDIWVNKANGDVHLFTYGSYGMIGYFYKPANGAWNDTVHLLEVGNVSRWRFIDSPDGNLYLILSQGGFKFIRIPKSGITGLINIQGLDVVPINSDDGFTSSYAIWPEVKEFQTTPVGGIHFAYPGNDFSYSNLLRHVSLKVNDGNVLVNVNVPNGREAYDADVNQKLSWYTKSNAGIDSVRIELSTDNGTTWTLVSARVKNTGSYLWKVPRISSTQCRIRLLHPQTLSVYDISNAPFTIQYVPVVQKLPSARIIRPSKDTTVTINALFPVKGSASDTDGYIVNYKWQMGDGQTINGIVTEFDYAYETPGTYMVLFSAQDNDNLFSVPDTLFVTVAGSNSVTMSEPLPSGWAVLNTYPNPFNAETNLSIQLAERSAVRVGVFNVLGQQIKVLHEGTLDTGSYSIRWDGKDAHANDIPSGVYLFRVQVNGDQRIVKALLLR